MSHQPTTPDITLSEAAEIRDENGDRRFGHIDTLRRRIRDGKLRATMRNGKYFIAQADLEAMLAASKRERAFDELRTAAIRVASLAPSISADRREVILSILKGGR